MTYEEAMDAVRASALAPRGCARFGRIAARRRAWVNETDSGRNAVIIWDIDSESSEWSEFQLNQFGTSDPNKWGIDFNCCPYYPSEDDMQANDWEIHKLRC